jgi:beta-lactamase regulating signal transducer with metallopeptidase domain
MNLADSVFAGLVELSSLPAWVLVLSKATLLLTISWLIHFTLARANPRWRVLLWRGVVVGLTLLFAWSIALPALEVSVSVPEAAVTMSAPSLPSEDAKLIPVGFPEAAQFSTDASTPVELTATAPRGASDVAVEPLRALKSFAAATPWRAVVFGLWIFGVALLVVRVTIGYARLRNLLQTSRPAPDAVVAEARRIGAALSCRRTAEVRSSPRFAVPILCGLRRPVIVLPERMCERPFCEQLPAILAHELAHARSWDLVSNAAVQAIQIVLWFHPLVWRIGSAHRAACDAVCDAVSASHVGDVPGYCQTLAQVALDANKFGCVGVLTMANSCDVLRRVATLQRRVFAMPLGRRTVSVIALAGLVSASLLAGIRLTLAQEERAATNDLFKHVVLIQAETRPRGLERTFPAIVMANDGEKSILLSASWGAEPFPGAKGSKMGIPLGAVFLRDTNANVKVVAYDESLGVGLFSVNKRLEPVPKDAFTDDLKLGDELTELRLSPSDPEKLFRVLSVEERYKRKTVTGQLIAVEHAICFDGERLNQRPGSLLLKNGKIAAVYLNNRGYRGERVRRYALPIQQAREAFAQLLAPKDPPSKNPETEKADKRGPIMRGRIVDGAGQPVPAVEVILYGGLATRFPGQTTATDANGEYRFDPLKTGAIILPDEGGSEHYTGVQFKHAEYVPADGHSWRDVNVPTLDRHEKVLDVTMTRGGKVRGIVVDAESGKPVPELNLRIHNGFITGKENGTFHVNVTTGADGTFLSEPIFPGQYVIDINDGNYQGKYRYPKIGKAEVRAGESTELRLTTSERPDLQDPFHITGTALGDDGKSMVYGGAGLRIIGSDNRLRTRGGGIDGRNVFGLKFGPIERTEPSKKSPYGVGTYDVELIGNNRRFSYKLKERTPSEPLRITDNPDQAELVNGIRYIRPNQPVKFRLVFTAVNPQPKPPKPAAEPNVQNTPQRVERANYVVVPWANTELQLSWGSGTPLNGYVLIDGNSLYTKERKFDSQALDWDQLTRDLEPFADRRKGAVNFHVFNYSLQADNSHLVGWALEGFGRQRGGFKTAFITQSYSGPGDFWKQIAVWRRSREGRQEGPEPRTGNELVHVYPVHTFGSSLQNGGADCVVEIVPRLISDTGHALPEEIQKAILELVPQVPVDQKKMLRFRVTYNEPVAEKTFEWFRNTGAKELARMLNYKDGSASGAGYR